MGSQANLISSLRKSHQRSSCVLPLLCCPLQTRMTAREEHDWQREIDCHSWCDYVSLFLEKHKPLIPPRKCSSLPYKQRIQTTALMSTFEVAAMSQVFSPITPCNSHKNLHKWVSLFSSFLNEGIEAQKDKGTCPRPYRKENAGLVLMSA